MSEDLEFTGERFTPECLREIRYEHFHRYALAAHWVAGLRVLDAACGEGYGSSLLAAKAREVTGVDVAAKAVAHAKSRYSAKNLAYFCADCCATPFANNSFDCIVSFETLEHLENQRALLTEFRRLLKPSGFLIISSPDKAVYTDKMGNANPFHLSELYRSEFENLLAEFFPSVRWLGQKLGFHSMIWPLQLSGSKQFLLQQESNTAVEELQQAASEPVYLLAICANTPSDMPNFEQDLFLFDDASESVYQHYYHEIGRNLETGRILQDLEARVASLQATLHATNHPAAGEKPTGATKTWWQRVLQKLEG